MAVAENGRQMVVMSKSGGGYVNNGSDNQIDNSKNWWWDQDPARRDDREERDHERHNLQDTRVLGEMIASRIGILLGEMIRRKEITKGTISKRILGSTVETPRTMPVRINTTEQSFCDCDGDGDEGNDDLHGNSDLLLLLPLTLGFLVVVHNVRLDYQLNNTIYDINTQIGLSSFVWLLIRLPRGTQIGLSSFVWLLIHLPRGRDGKQNKHLNEMPWQWMKSID
ncbi:hypothetical protein LWI29_009828 [Acer saccharum]|uniref:Uncharacterized protein n=1 Tax=Acer saccharum TaxID=4024 RepID=A0AA39S6K9_ACESA|nr:hypothetical protein LWI29_009828 [Acer saccharum]